MWLSTYITFELLKITLKNIRFSVEKFNKIGGFNIKKELFSIFILFVLLSMTCVSAIETNQDNYTQTGIENDEILTNCIYKNQNIDKISNYDDILSSDSENNGNFLDLAYEIEQSDTSLELTKNYIYNSETDENYVNGIIINKSITIDGKGHTISGNNLARIFYVNASDVTLKNIVFANGYLNGTESYGGAIYWNGNYGNITNCTFTGNKIDNVLAGAIYWQGNYGSIDKSTFNSNSAKNSGAVQWNGTQGSISNSVFTENTATISSGGAICWYGDNGKIYNSNFTSNKGNLLGGALYAYSTYLNVTLCNFNINSISLPYVGRGGAIDFVNVSGNIKDSIFNNNYLFNSMFMFNGMGGALSWTGDSNYTGNIINCTFAQNKGTAGYNIYTNSSLNIFNSTFTDSSNVESIFNNGELYLKNNTLTNGIIFINDGFITSPTTVTVETSSDVVEIGDEVTITGTITDDNNNIITLSEITCTVDGDEIGTAGFDSTGSFTGTYTASKEGNLTVSVNANNILTSAIVNTANITSKQKDPVFKSIAELINSTSEGGTLYLTQNYTFSSSTDEDYAAGILINKSITIDGQGFTINGNNLARSFYVNASGVVFKNITFIKCKSDNGGAIYSASDVTIEHCNFSYNNAENGGAAYLAGGNINNSIFTNNSATYGGAVYYSERGNVTSTEFINNTAATSGGAIYFEKKGYITNSTFTNNVATENNGGAAYFKKTGTIINSEFIKNSAPGNNGGAAFFKDNEATIVNSTFINNSADKGGAVYVKEIGNVNNSVFINNQATKHGGAVYIIENATVINSNFTSNAASKNGGAIYLEGVGTIDNDIFTNNSANAGTSIYLNNATSILNSIFSDASNSNTIYNTDDTKLENNVFNNDNYIVSSSISSKTKIILSDTLVYKNNEVNITGIIVDENGNIVKCENIIITLNGTTITTSFNDDGSFYATYSANTSFIGNLTISAAGYTSTLTNTTLIEATLTVKKITPVIGIAVNNTTYPNDLVIQITGDIDGNYTYTIGSISNAIILTNGSAKITLSKLAIGTYTVTVNYNETENYSSAYNSATFKIIESIQENSNVKMYYLDDSTYKVRIYGSDGNTTGAGVSVTFKINGKTYIRTTNSNGYAILKLNINTLVPKTYTITATYNGYTVKNTVKVKQIIKAKKTTKVKKTAKKLKVKITLKGKTVLKKKTLKVKFKGKTYKIKTNKKGNAYFKLTKKVIKKLKKGKTYKYTITYNKNTLKRYIKVKK